jgi:uncharacterized protein YcfL
MKTSPRLPIACLCALLIGLFLLSGCTSTKTQNGVTIEQQRSINPLDYIPGL